jgi:hypothetical protein
MMHLLARDYDIPCGDEISHINILAIAINLTRKTRHSHILDELFPRFPLSRFFIVRARKKKP